MVIFPDPLLSVLLTIPFLVTMAGMHFILFKPMMEYLRERDGVSETARLDTQNLLVQIDERMDALNARIEAARAEVGDHRSAARKRALDEEKRIIDEARHAAEAHVKDAVVQIRKERDVASAALKDAAKTLSGDVAAQILGREIHA